MNTTAGVAEDPGQAVAAGAHAYAEDRYEDARVLFEQAFRGFLTLGQRRSAARVATLLGELHWSGLGNPSTGRGWLERGRRLLADSGPCLELGYWELARVACDRPDILELLASAARALELAEAFGDPGLHTRALADSGFALVCSGRLDEGFARLEEALAVISAREVDDPLMVGTICCALLSACDRAGDLDRASEWLRMVDELVLGPSAGRPRVLGAHCQLARGGTLLSAGRLSEAESSIRAALARTSGASATQRADAAARLAALCVQSGRLDEAGAVLAGLEDQPATAFPAALLQQARGEHRAAIALLNRALDQVPGDVLRSCVLLCLLMESALAVADGPTEETTQARLRSLAESSPAPIVLGAVGYAEGCRSMAGGDAVAARNGFETAVAEFSAARQPWHLARSYQALATMLSDSDPQAAQAFARSGYAVAERCGMLPIRDACAAALRRLGTAPPRPASPVLIKGLSPRETDVLRALRQGGSNSEIAAALFLSPKTVEHHVSRILTKLGVRTRAEAAAVAVAAELADHP
jgi:DNA-binding CsgD family transcriptional regulator/tetratricopeptide (TPR) repeat protein